MTIALPSNYFRLFITPHEAASKLCLNSNLLICCALQPSPPNTRHMLLRPVAALASPLARQSSRRSPGALMCGAAANNTPTTATAPVAMHWSDSPLASAKYASELNTACLAVQLASKLCQTVQQQLQSSETAGKQDDSPVTVADYGACIPSWLASEVLCMHDSDTQAAVQVGHSMALRCWACSACMIN